MNPDRSPIYCRPLPDEQLMLEFQLGDWVVQPTTGELRGKGTQCRRLEPRVMQVLLYLIARPKRLVTKEELLNEVWGEVFVTEDALWRCIVALRKALDDDANQPRYVETLPRRGYRLIAEVSELTRQPEEDDPDQVKAIERNIDPTTIGKARRLPRPWRLRRVSPSFPWVLLALLGAGFALALWSSFSPGEGKG